MNAHSTIDASIDPVDIYVGSRVRQLRKALKISQETLAGHLGLTFQQVQKYEKGTNRISASKLFAIAGVLEVPAAYFFDGLDTLPVANPLDDVALTAAMINPKAREVALGLGALSNAGLELAGAVVAALHPRSTR